LTPELFDQATRVLEYAPGRSLPADMLCERLRTEAGLSIGLRPFLDALGTARDRFALLQPPLVVTTEPGWHVTERMVYERALCEARLGVPTVTLAGGHDAETDSLPAAAPVGPAAVLADAQNALRVLLEVHVEDVEFRSELIGAAAQLEAARQLLAD
jgi:hypothetical protein